VLIEVRAAGVSFADTLMIQGRYQVQPDYPFTPGFEVAGVVRAAPSGAGVVVGDEVMAITGTGGFAELAHAEPHDVMAKPPSLSWTQAAGFTGNAHTAWYALVDRGHLTAGQLLLVHGAAGGVGLAATQLATALGARVLGVVSSAERAALVRAAGAEATVQSDGDWAREVREAVGEVDVVLDSVGAQRTEPSLRLLRRHGRLLVVGFAGGAVAKLPLQHVLNSDADVVGVAWRPAAEDPTMTRRIGAALAPLVDSGRLDPHIGGVFALDDAFAAYRALEARQATGKLVLEITG
jgi:NADPH2:quinone reductase